MEVIRGMKTGYWGTDQDPHVKKNSTIQKKSRKGDGVVGKEVDKRGGNTIDWG